MYVMYSQVITNYMNKKYIFLSQIAITKELTTYFFFVFLLKFISCPTILQTYSVIKTMLIKTIQVCSVLQCNNITI